MKKIVVRILQIIFVSFFLFTSPIIFSQVHGAETKIWSEIVTALDKETDSYNAYSEFADRIESLNPDTFISEFKRLISSWKITFNEARNVYEKYISSTESNLNEVANKAYDSASKTLQALDEYDKALSGDIRDKEEITAAFNRGDVMMQEGALAHDDVISLYNNYSGANAEKDFENTLNLSVIASLFLSIVFWFKSRTTSNYQADLIKAQIFKNLFKDSLWLFGGLLITKISYSSVSKEGGTYYILYGPILVGVWKMLSGIWTYFTKERKVLNQLRAFNSEDLLKKTIK